MEYQAFAIVAVAYIFNGHKHQNDTNIDDNSQNSTLEMNWNFYDNFTITVLKQLTNGIDPDTKTLFETFTCQWGQTPGLFVFQGGEAILIGGVVFVVTFQGAVLKKKIYLSLYICV